MKVTLLSGVCLVGLLGCESVTAERIESWKGTQKGPDKIEQALRATEVAPILRAQAAAALVDLGKPEKVDDIMATIPAAIRWEIVKSLVEIHSKGMQGANVPKARDARDALFSVRGYAPPDEQQRIDGLLMASVENDLKEGRFSGGRHSLDKMLLAFGTASGPMLVKLFGDPKAPFRGLAELAVKVCDAKTLEAAGTALLKRTPEKEAIPTEMWLAMGTLGGRPVAEFLEKKFEKGTPEEAQLAGRALQQSRFPSALPMALRVAGSAKAKRELRDEAFGIVEKTGSPEAQRGLLRIIAEDKDELVRYRAHEAVIEVGKEKAIVPALEAFPAAISYKREDLLDFLVKDITKLGPKAKSEVLLALSSSSPVARMTAVLALGTSLPANPKAKLGESTDAAMVLKLAGDKATIKGFPVGTTIGSEAQRVAGLLQGKGG